MSSKKPTKTMGWTEMFAKGKQFLSHIRHPPCFSSSQGLLGTTISKQTHIANNKQLGVKMNRTSFYDDIVVDITRRD
jgi:hypothetical protein